MVGLYFHLPVSPHANADKNPQRKKVPPWRFQPAKSSESSRWQKWCNAVKICLNPDPSALRMSTQEEQCTVLRRKGIQIQVSSGVDGMSIDDNRALFLPHRSRSLVERFSFALVGRVSECSLLNVGWPISVLDGFKNTEFKRVNSSEATKLTTICSEPHEKLVVQERIHTNGPTLQQCRNAVAGFICLRSIPTALNFASWAAHHSGEERYQEYLMPQRNLPSLCGFEELFSNAGLTWPVSKIYQNQL